MAASVLICAAATARAEDGQIRIRLAGLDLKSARGAQVAAERIRNAAAAVCQEEDRWHFSQAAGEVNRCVAATIRAALDQLDAPLVSARFGGGAVAAPSEVAAVARR